MIETINFLKDLGVSLYVICMFIGFVSGFFVRDKYFADSREIKITCLPKEYVAFNVLITKKGDKTKDVLCTNLENGKCILNTKPCKFYPLSFFGKIRAKITPTKNQTTI
ncbi:hypothetical protein B6S12_07600 [Helicobacter valdiviensis]|uniref:Uncharacterized protein n=1 Tax=Helicobacter valdiviensis TaxID=1458358 RepID=A0A2W6MTB2_9HELI|nr:hypothetical protein [Helicobacter valdiviensis]PZT47717.1 hypothetical protein B6S12_07600 [Helicobacter valdiviensis]